MEKTDCIFGSYFIFGLILFIVLISNVRLSNDDIKSIVEIVLNGTEPLKRELNKNTMF